MPDPKTATNQMEAPCIGGPADGMRIPIKPHVRPHIEVEDRLSGQEQSRNRAVGRAPNAVRYLAERLRGGEADLVFYRPESMSIEHALFHLISSYPRSSRKG